MLWIGHYITSTPWPNSLYNYVQSVCLSVSHEFPCTCLVTIRNVGIRYLLEARHDIHNLILSYLPAVQYFSSSIQYQYKDLKSTSREVRVMAIDVPSAVRNINYTSIWFRLSFHSAEHCTVPYRMESYRIVPYAVYLIPYASTRPRSWRNEELTFDIKQNKRFSTVQYRTVLHWYCNQSFPFFNISMQLYTVK